MSTWANGTAGTSDFPATTGRIIIRERYQYVGAPYDGDELYDLQEDPFELHNLIDSSSHRDVAQELRAGVVDHIESRRDRVAERLAYALRRGF
jgi:hypothetical protein